MKKIILAAGIGAVSLALSACTDPETDKTDTSDGAAAEKPALPDEVPAEDATVEEADDGGALDGMQTGDRANTTGRTPTE